MVKEMNHSFTVASPPVGGPQIASETPISTVMVIRTKMIFTEAETPIETRMPASR